jgi:hypothetical protein
MNNKFIISIGPVTQEQSLFITNIFKDKYTWWHWIDGFWLVIDHTNTLTPQNIADSMHDVAPLAKIFVLNTKNSIWHCYYDKKNENEMIGWIKDQWDKS